MVDQVNTFDTVFDTDAFEESALNNSGVVHSLSFDEQPDPTDPTGSSPDPVITVNDPNSPGSNTDMIYD